MAEADRHREFCPHGYSDPFVCPECSASVESIDLAETYFVLPKQVILTIPSRLMTRHEVLEIVETLRKEFFQSAQVADSEIGLTISFNDIARDVFVRLAKEHRSEIACELEEIARD